MSNTNNKVQRRATVADGKLKYYLQDDENTYMYKPVDMFENKFFGTFSRVATLGNLLDHETTNYALPYQAYYKGKSELYSVPQCFDRCI